jgi:aspartate kinase
LQVYKFGGASIATPERMTALLPIISVAEKPLVVVVSALGKTTNALELVVDAAHKGDIITAHERIATLEREHFAYASAILKGTALQQFKDALTIIITEMQWACDDATQFAYGYVYDQIVSLGELMSTNIFSQYLAQEGYSNTWLDARDIIRTDNNYRDAQVDEAFTHSRVAAVMRPTLEQKGIVVTQGFIGSTDENCSTTLGREGSDYSAALFGNMLDAAGVTIWKDVAGLLNADPRLFNDTVKIPEISYYEVIEMAYYGAQVIHPKTIKPLHNKGIPLYVKCFLDADIPGTVIKKAVTAAYPPIIVYKKDQVLVQVISKDYSFVTEDVLSEIYEIFARHHVKINIMQNAAISLVVSIDNREDKIAPLIADLAQHFDVRRNDSAELLTVRHYTDEIIQKLTKGRTILLEQKSRKTAQFIVR